MNNKSIALAAILLVAGTIAIIRKRKANVGINSIRTDYHRVRR